MDKKALLSNLITVHDNLSMLLEESVSEYKELLSIRHLDETEERLICLDGKSDIEKLSDKLTENIEETNTTLSKLKPLLNPSSRIMLDKRRYDEPLVERNDMISYFYNESIFRSVIEKINKINETKLNIEDVIERIEDLPEFENNVIYKIEYEPQKHKFTINNKSVPIKRSAKDDIFLKAFFMNSESNILNGEVCNEDILALAEEDGIRFTEEEKTAKRKFIDGGYRHLNDKVRSIVPDNKDLVIQIKNGFVLNTELEVQL